LPSSNKNASDLLPCKLSEQIYARIRRIEDDICELQLVSHLCRCNSAVCISTTQIIVDRHEIEVATSLPS